jgi:hypothetical protein
MTITTNLAQFLIDVVTNIFVLKITLPGMLGETRKAFLRNDVINNGSVLWTYVNGVATQYVPANNGNISTKDNLINRLNMCHGPTYHLTIEYYNSISGSQLDGSIAMGGDWLKIFKLNPSFNDVLRAGHCVTINAVPIHFKPQVAGYQMLYMHANFARDVLAANSLNDGYNIVPRISCGV